MGAPYITRCYFVTRHHPIRKLLVHFCSNIKNLQCQFDIVNISRFSAAYSFIWTVQFRMKQFVYSVKNTSLLLYNAYEYKYMNLADPNGNRLY